MRSFISVLIVAVATPACVNAPATLTELVTARRLASEVHVTFSQATEASSRAVLAETDDDAATAAEDARRSRPAIEKGLGDLRAVLQSLGYSDDVDHVDRVACGVGGCPRPRPSRRWTRRRRPSIGSRRSTPRF